MTTRVTVSGLDYSLEGTSMSLYFPTLTAANFDAQATARATVQTAIQNVSLIDFEGLQFVGVDAARETDRPASQYAQREAKWLVTMSDDVNGKTFQFEIGGPDLTLLSVDDGSSMDTSGGAGAALVTALEANLVSPDGNACTFVKAVHVGRNN